MENFVFGNKYRSLLYFMLRNDLAWKLLTNKEQNMIKQVNQRYNTEREDYSNIDKFGTLRQVEGERWDTFNFNTLINNPFKGKDALYLDSQLNKFNPKKVLEVGSGPGLFSRMIYEHKSVVSLSVNDINAGFINFIVEQEKNTNKRKLLNSYVGDVLEVNIPEKFDMISIVSSLHHMPEREKIFKLFSELLNPQGTIVISEPSHYIKRILWLIKKRKTISRKMYLENIQNYSTHHMCTVGEYKKIVRKINDLSIQRIDFDDPKKIQNNLIKKIFSSRIHITIQKK
tara:strand:- start:506 stop:1360 length:855 start_codon:yes stop_codon:yes gene_type:complete